MNFRKIAILIILFSNVFSYGQQYWSKGELYLKNGTILKGFVKLPIVSKSDAVSLIKKGKIKFKLGHKKKVNRYSEPQLEKIILISPDEIRKSFNFILISKKEKALFEVILKGEVSLYRRNVRYASKMSGGGYFDEFFVLKKRKKIAIPLITVGRVGAFRKRALNFFSDCSHVVDKLLNNTYKKEDVKDVVKRYNECNN